MHPEKEGKHLLRRLVDMWGYYTDGWLFSCTWDRAHGESGGWALCAEHANPLDHDPPQRVRVTARVTREEWVARHVDAVDDAAEAMYLDSFKPENRVEVGACPA